MNPVIFPSLHTSLKQQRLLRNICQLNCQDQGLCYKNTYWNYSFNHCTEQQPVLMLYRSLLSAQTTGGRKEAGDRETTDLSQGRQLPHLSTKILTEVNSTQALKHFCAPGFKPRVQKQRGRSERLNISFFLLHPSLLPKIPSLSCFQTSTLILSKTKDSKF